MISRAAILPMINGLFLALLLCFSHGLLKWISSRSSESYWQAALQYWWVMCGAISVYVFIFFYYAYILKYVSISILYPVYTGLSIVLVFTMGVFVFNEPYTWQHVAGCALIVAGVFLVSGMTG